MAGYGDNDGLSAYLAAQGLTLPVGANLDVLRQIGSDYVDSAYEAFLSCSNRTEGVMQERAWPRTGHYLNGESVPDDFIPPAWVNASYRAAYLQAVNAGWATGGTNPNRITKREKVDTLEREFFAAGEGSTSATIAPGFNVDPLINGMVSIWLCPQTRTFGSLFRVI